MSKIPILVLSVLYLGFAVATAHAQDNVPVHSIDGEWMNEWLVLGPFFPNDLEKDFLADVGGETNINPQEGKTVTTAAGQTLTWKRYTSAENRIDLLDAVSGAANATAYAFCLVQSELAHSIKVGLGSDDGVAVFFNGLEAHSHHVARGVTLDEDVFSVQMKVGINRCLVKVYNGDGLWEFAMRFLYPISSLMNQLADENPDVRNRAVRALGRIGEPAVAPLIEAWRADQMLANVALALAQIGEPAIPVLTTALSDPREYIRPLAAGAVAQIDETRRDEMIQILVAAITHPQPLVRNHAAWALGQIGEPANATVPALIQALTDADDWVRRHAAGALGRMGESATRAVPALIRALDDVDAAVRRHAARALGHIDEPAKPAVPALIDAVTDEDVTVRREAVWALGEIGGLSEATIQALTQTLSDVDKEVRRNSAFALQKASERAEAVVPALAQALSDEDAAVRRAVSRTLVEFGERATAAVPALINVLNDGDKDVRNYAAWALGRMGESASEAVPALINVLVADTNSAVRNNATWALGRMGESAQSAVPALINVLSDADDGVRIKSRNALKRIGIPESMKDVYEVREKSYAMIIAGVLLAFGLLHLLLFLFHPKSVNSLYYAILVGSVAAVTLLSISENEIILRGKDILLFGVFVINLRFLYSLFYSRLPRQFFIFLGGWVVISVWWSFVPLSFSSLFTAIFIIAVPLLFLISSLVEIFRVLIWAILKKKDGAWIIGSGFTVFAVAFVGSIVVQFAAPSNSPIVDSIVVFAMLCLLISMSFHLARNFGRTQKTLETQNQQISNLNEQLKDENLRMGAELEITEKIQQLVLPTKAELKSVADLDIAGYMEPAHEVGGDYYDVLQQNGHLKIAIGDVTGHGLESGMVMLMTQSIVRGLLESGETDATVILAALNRAIYQNVQRMDSDKNLTLCLLDYADGEVKLSGQHEEMIVVRQNGKIELVDTIDLGFPIGLDDEIAEFIDQTTVQLAAGDGVVLYTDGITEAENKKREQYGLDRLCEVVRGNWPRSADEIKDAVVGNLFSFIGTAEIYDDITLVVLKQK